MHHMRATNFGGAHLCWQDLPGDLSKSPCLLSKVAIVLNSREASYEVSKRMLFASSMLELLPVITLFSWSSCSHGQDMKL